MKCYKYAVGYWVENGKSVSLYDTDEVQFAFAKFELFKNIFATTFMKRTATDVVRLTLKQICYMDTGNKIVSEHVILKSVIIE